MKLNARYVLNPVFIIALVLLLLNDHWAKYEFHNVITSKLSDFAGIIVLGLFLTAFYDCRRWIPVLITGLFFTFWKLPVSQGFINGWNALDLIPIGRTVDATDLIVLVFLPVVYYYDPEEIKIRRWVVSTLSVVTFCSLCATSVARRLGPTPIRFKSKLTREAFISTLEKREQLHIRKSDTLWYDGTASVRYQLYYQKGENQVDSSHFIDSCTIRISPKNKRKIRVDIEKLYLAPGINFNWFDVQTHKEAYKICSKIKKESMYRGVYAYGQGYE